MHAHCTRSRISCPKVPASFTALGRFNKCSQGKNTTCLHPVLRPVPLTTHQINSASAKNNNNKNSASARVHVHCHTRHSYMDPSCPQSQWSPKQKTAFMTDHPRFHYFLKTRSENVIIISTQCTPCQRLPLFLSFTTTFSPSPT